MPSRIIDAGTLSGVLERMSGWPLVGPLIRHRFFKFGTVGLSGTVVNLALLSFNQEILFKGIGAHEIRLRLSLGVAIFFATVNNYLWNRLWTWGDRKGKTRYGFFVQMGQYFLACGLAICLQYLITILFSRIVHYLIANVASIVISAILVYVINDLWTFAVKRTPVEGGPEVVK